MVGAGGSGLRAINGTVEFNGNTVINLSGDVAYIDRYVPAFGIWNGATPMALLQLPAHMLLTGNTQINTTGAGSAAVVTELAGGTTEFLVVLK